MCLSGKYWYRNHANFKLENMIVKTLWCCVSVSKKKKTRTSKQLGKMFENKAKSLIYKTQVAQKRRYTNPWNENQTSIEQNCIWTWNKKEVEKHFK